MAYHLEGRLLEVCDCRVLCPCWIGEDPDNGTCDFDRWPTTSTRARSTVSMSRAAPSPWSSHIPGNILQGNWRVARLPRRQCHERAGRGPAEGLHRQARRPDRRLRQADRRGGLRRARADPLRCPQGGKGTIKIGDVTYAELEPYQGATASTTTLSNTIFSTVPGAPVFVGKAPRYRSKQRGARHRPRHERAQRAAEHVRVRRLSPAPAGRRDDAGHWRDGTSFLPVIGALIAMALGDAVSVGAEPVRPLPRPWPLDRRRLRRSHVPRPAGRDVLLPGLLYVGGWLLMSAAMMLPTVLPLLELFERLTDGAPRPRGADRAADRRLSAGLGRVRPGGASAGCGAARDGAAIALARVQRLDRRRRRARASPGCFSSAR